MKLKQTEFESMTYARDISREVPANTYRPFTAEELLARSSEEGTTLKRVNQDLDTLILAGLISAEYKVTEKGAAWAQTLVVD